jgi:Flp pilus assembly pilin Flp
MEMRDKLAAYVRDESGGTIIEYVMIGLLLAAVASSILLA